MILALMMASGTVAQVVNPTPFFTFFFDSTSTFNGQLLIPGTIIEAFDIDNVLNGRDTVTIPGQYGFMPVYGDDNNSPIDEGALEGEPIRFTINGREATVIAGDNIWSNMAIKKVTLNANSLIAISAVTLPMTLAALPDDTIQFRVRVKNDGDGLDFYGVRLSMSIPDDGSMFGWKALAPDSFVYAAAGAEADVFFSIKVARFSPDTVNTISFSVFSHLDTTVSVDGNLSIFLTLTDVDDNPTNILPSSFALNQNYPNPFNPSTTISFQLPFGSEVGMRIYDLLGRTVDSRDFGFLPAGSHAFTYDASRLASGVYFYRIESASGSATRKMSLVK